MKIKFKEDSNWSPFVSVDSYKVMNLLLTQELELLDVALILLERNSIALYDPKLVTRIMRIANLGFISAKEIEIEL